MTQNKEMLLSPMDLKLSEDWLKEQFEAKLQGRDKVITDCDHKIESL